MFNPFMLKEAIHSTALSCGCGKCVACRAADGDEEAWMRLSGLLHQEENDAKHTNP